MALTRAEQSRLNGKKGGRKPKTQGTREFPELNDFRWQSHENVPEQSQDQQHGEYLSVQFVRRGRWKPVWIQKSVQIADTRAAQQEKEING